MRIRSELVSARGRARVLARVVELRFFGGLSVEETAAALELSERTVKREWRKLRAFLFDALRQKGFVPSGLAG